jgi:hypothetical protein
LLLNPEANNNMMSQDADNKKVFVELFHMVQHTVGQYTHTSQQEEGVVVRRWVGAGQLMSEQRSADELFRDFLYNVVVVVVVVVNHLNCFFLLLFT